KDTFIGGLPVKVAYSFDNRVSPAHRRLGVGHAMVEEKLKWAKAAGAVGVYSLIVTTNQASLGMVAKSRYKKIRLVMYLEFLPYPMLEICPHQPICHHEPTDTDLIDATYYPRDLYIPYVSKQVAHLDFQRWTLKDEGGNYAAVSVYNQSKVYMQIYADDP